MRIKRVNIFYSKIERCFFINAQSLTLLSWFSGITLNANTFNQTYIDSENNDTLLLEWKNRGKKWVWISFVNLASSDQEKSVDVSILQFRFNL